MKKATIRLHQPIIPDGLASEIAQPPNRAFHDPATSITAQLPPILVGGSLVVGPSLTNRLNAATNQQGPGGIAIVSPIGNQPVRPLPGSPRPVRMYHPDRVERRVEEPDFRRGRRVQVCSQWNTRAIDPYHPLCALPALGRPNCGAPFFAGAKLPSTKHSFQRSFWASCNWANKARHSVSSAPLASLSRSRRQHMLGLPYRLGNSLQGAPVHSIQRIPSKQHRASIGGRPPFGERWAAARWRKIWSHCASVTWRQAIRSPFWKETPDVASTYVP